MLKLSYLHANKVFIAVRACDEKKLVSFYGKKYGRVYATERDGYKLRGVPLSRLPVVLGDFDKVVFVR